MTPYVSFIGRLLRNEARVQRSVVIPATWICVMPEGASSLTKGPKLLAQDSRVVVVQPFGALSGRCES